MIEFSNYILDVNPNSFIFRDKNNNPLNNLKPILKLKKVYILDKNEIIDYLSLKKSLLINIELESKIIIFLFEPKNDYEKVFGKLINLLSTNKTKLKAIPILKNIKSVFIRTNQPVIINKYFNIERYIFNNNLELKINLNQTLPKLFINKLKKQINSKIFVALTTHTKKNDDIFICYFGFENLHKFIN